MGEARDDAGRLDRVPDGLDAPPDVVQEWGEESFPASDAPTGWQGPEDYPIEEAPGRLVAHVDGHEASLVYELDGDRLVIIHTEVPASIEGRGVGGRLVASAVALAAGAGRTVVPRCPFARRWLSAHPDVRATVDIDWTRPSPGAGG